MEKETVKLSILQNNTGQIDGLPQNPRFIKDEKFKKLCENIRKYPKFLEIRPIVVKSWDRPVIIAGNMRFQALKFIGYTDIPKAWVKTAEDYTLEELKAFTILDNVPFGENDWDLLANDWETESLSDWGMDLPKFDEEEISKKVEFETSENKIIDCPNCHHRFSVLKQK